MTTLNTGVEYQSVEHRYFVLNGQFVEYPSFWIPAETFLISAPALNSIEWEMPVEADGSSHCVFQHWTDGLFMWHR